MFEDSLIESTGAIRTRSSRYAAGSLLLQAALAAVLVVVPYIYPAALPPKFLSVPLIAPPPAPAAQIVQQRMASSPTSRPELLLSTLIAPGHIPQTIHHVVDTGPPGLVPGADIGGDSSTGAMGSSWLGAVTNPPTQHLRQAKPSGPLKVSAGVAAGQLLTPIRPPYPAIALAGRIQGTVVVAAIIGKDGRISSLRVVSGSPLLAGAAVEAIRQARYRPWTLNGEPVEVETTINVVFTLGGN